jgi:hypothetical protein
MFLFLVSLLTSDSFMKQILLDSNTKAFPNPNPNRKGDTDLIPKPLTHEGKSASIAALMTLGLVSGYPSTALANIRTKGAFEMDMDYYIRDLVLGTGSIKEKEPERARIQAGRSIDSKFAADILNVVEIHISDLSKTSRDVISDQINLSVPIFLNYFKTFVDFNKEDISDEHYFDFKAYVTFKVAEKFVPTSKERVKLRSMIGRSILSLVRQELISSGQKDLQEVVLEQRGTPQALPLAAYGIRQILDVFIKKGLLANFVLEDDDYFDELYARKIFDEGLTISSQLTLKQPATILSFLEFTASDTFFHPEFFGSPLKAYLNELGLQAHFEDYLLDNEYRSNNFNVQAQDVIYEIIVKKGINYSIS